LSPRLPAQPPLLAWLYWAIAELCSAEDPDLQRVPQHGGARAGELAG
jgi:hypothetical protein